MSEARATPKGWTIARLGDVGHWYGGGTPSKFEPRFWTNGTIPWVSPKDMKALRITDSQDHLSAAAIQETNIREFPSGTVLFVIRSGILARTFPVGVAEVSGTMNQDLKGVRPIDGVEPLFLAYQLIGREREVLNRCSKHGTTVASIDTERLHDFEVRMAPPAEQIRIVAKIEELFSDLDAGVAALERVRVSLKRYRASVLKAAVEGRLTEEWRKRNPVQESGAQLLERILAERRAKWEQEQLRKFKEAGKTPPKGWREKYKQPPSADTKNLAAPPPSWCWATIEQLSIKVVDGVHRKPNYTDSGIPFVTVRNLTAGPGISFEKLNYVSEADHTEFSKRTDVQRGDILISKDGTLGVTRVVRTDIPFSIFVSVALVKPVHYEYSEYLGRAMSSLPVQNQMVPKGSGLQHIHLEDLRCDAVPLPPLAEQAEIVAEVDRRLSVADAAEQQIEHALQRAARLRQSILRRAFEGKLVPQNPTDEPAAAHLERTKPPSNGNLPAQAKPSMRGSGVRV
ncbi:MAG: restriction endonuclease subunit S [Planctomycetes bacterium]|nr:restriction endonuclease subunit S [Planctomycetota bacterium]